MNLSLGDIQQIHLLPQQDLSTRIFLSAIEQSPNIVIITDVNGCIVYVNPKFTLVTGFLSCEASGQNPRILKSNKTSQKVYQDLWQTISAGQEWRGELQDQKRNGDYYWVSTSISPIKNERDEITHFIGIQEDITNRKRIERENTRLFKAVQNQHSQLVAQAQQLRQLTQQVVNAQEAERYRVSRELHDVTGQMLTLIKIGLETLNIDLKTEINTLGSTEWSQFENRLIDLIATCDQTISQIRELAHDLRPTALDDLGLNMALKTLCKDFGRHGHLQVDYRGAELLTVPADTVGISLYRVLQEALTNVAKHADANRVDVRLEKVKDGICLIIEDDGRGFINSTNLLQGKGIGILSMTERLESLGGHLRFETAAGKGTRLAAFIPDQSGRQG